MRRLLTMLCLIPSIVTSIASHADTSLDTKYVASGEFLLELEASTSNIKLERELKRVLGQTSFSVSDIPNTRTRLLRLPTQEDGWVNFNDYLAALERVDAITQLEPNFAYFQDARITFGKNANDPKFSKQWYLDAINAPNAWQVSEDASDVVVAVIDDAIATDHADLAANVWRNKREIAGNNKDDDNNGYIDDTHGWNFGRNTNDPRPKGACFESGHGTHVSGTIAATSNNRKGVTGVAPKVKIMPLAVGREDGCGLYSDGILGAVLYAIHNGADIINLSLGGPFGSAIQKKIYKRANDAGVLVVIAAGNDGLSNDIEDLLPNTQVNMLQLRDNSGNVIKEGFSPSWPATYARAFDGFLSVANLSRSISLFEQREYRYSTYTPIKVRGGNIMQGSAIKLSKDYYIGSSYGSRSVQIAAPGTDIYNLVPTVNGKKGSGYSDMTGTSMASPIVAGAAALIKANFPSMRGKEIRSRLMLSAKPSNALKNKVRSGSLDVYAALCADQFKTRAKGCPNYQAPPPSAKKPANPVSKPAAKPPVKQEPTPPAKKVAPRKQVEDPNAWLRGEDSDQPADAKQRDADEGYEGPIIW